MSPIQKIINKHQTDFSKKVWILRLISLSIALGSVIYYIRQNKQHQEKLLEKTQIIHRGQSGSEIKFKIPVFRSK